MKPSPDRLTPNENEWPRAKTQRERARTSNWSLRQSNLHRYMSRGGLDQLLQLEHSGKLDPRVKTERVSNYLNACPSLWIPCPRPCLRILALLSSLPALLSSGRIGPLLLANLLAIVVSNIYPIPACPAAHAVPALVLDVALSEVAEESIDAPVLSAQLWMRFTSFFLSIPVQLSCSSYGSYIEKECES
ncbi:Photosystem i chlorophyll a apoprotein a1 [Thalictrum thalictroides]|uniref:Photosystem i chlorophyll a apoprotein a1 n=1 Tax=Thalictrum thalictroides TaxID=46969 RepID=A0A7J6VG67_THATH|nr:Photosystem i chlorophyll a apoprotein a1 [Thalictrum thalictroides]